MPIERDRAFALLSQPGTAIDGLNMLKRGAEEAPGDARAQFDYASACDMLDRGFEAAVYYERVRAIGLDTLAEKDQPRWYVQMGSTLRVLGRLQQSRAVLAEGRAKFPGYRAIAAFAALTEISAREPKAAARLLFEAVLAEPRDASIAEFGRALEAYVRDLFGDGRESPR